MSGKSKRFTSRGFREKSFIKIFDKYVIQHVRDMYLDIPNEDIYFIVRDDDWVSQTKLPQLFPRCHVKWISPNNSGPVISILDASLPFPNHEEVIVSYCDFMNSWNFNDFYNYCRDNSLDGCVTTHKGFHPHRLYNESFAFIRNDESRILEIKEKQSFTDNIINEHASNGTYYFAKYGDIKRYFKALVDSNETVQGEFYVTMTYNRMIADGMDVRLYETDDFICFGLPQDIELMRSWEQIINNSGIETSEDVNRTYSYWKKVIEGRK